MPPEHNTNTQDRTPDGASDLLENGGKKPERESDLLDSMFAILERESNVLKNMFDVLKRESNVLESMFDDPEAAEAEPVTPEPETAEAEPVTPEPETAEAEPVTPDPEAAEAEPVTPDPETAEAEPVTPDPEAAEAEPVTPEPETAETEPVTPEPKAAEAEPVTPEPETAEAGPVTPDPEAAETGLIVPGRDPEAAEPEPVTSEYVPIGRVVRAPQYVYEVPQSIPKTPRNVIDAVVLEPAAEDEDPEAAEYDDPEAAEPAAEYDDPETAEYDDPEAAEPSAEYDDRETPEPRPEEAESGADDAAVGYDMLGSIWGIPELDDEPEIERDVSAPRSHARKKKLDMRLIGLILCAVTIVAAVVAGAYLLGRRSGEKDTLDEDMAELRAIKELSPDFAPTLTPTGTPAASLRPSATPIPEAVILPEYQALYAQNNDMIGWLAIEDTVIDYPVVYTPWQNDYYLQRGFDGRSNSNGCLILDAASEPGVGTAEADYANGTPPSTNLIIHGHTMRSGAMFGRLQDYANADYGAAHSVIRFDTLYEHRTYELIAAFYTQVYYETDQVFKFYKFFQADTQEEFDYWYDNIKALSLYDTGVTAELGDEFITLSCCSYQVEDGRFVVVGKRVS